MRIDFNEFDGRILLACDHRRGIWSHETLTSGSRPIRTAGQMQTQASAHTLLSASLMVALANIPKAKAHALAKLSNRGKPRLLVETIDATFAAALQAKMRRQDGPTLRTGKNFLIELARHLSRFEVMLRTAEEEKPVLVVQNWAFSTVLDPRVFKPISPSLAPSTVSMMTPVRPL